MTSTEQPPSDPMPVGEDRRAWPVFLVFLRLGLTSFGGPVAHLGYFRAELVARRRWLGERAYADLVALCQFLPGPASSQVGMGMGYLRAGYTGALAAWAGFTLPSALALMLLALGLTQAGDTVPPGLLDGLKAAAVAVVAQAVLGMGHSLCPDTPRRLLALATAALVLGLPSPWTQLVVLVLAAALWHRWGPAPPPTASEPWARTPGRRAGRRWLIAFAVLLLGLPLLAAAVPDRALTMVDVFYRAGSLVFGGGHVVLPLLQAELVPRGWVSADAFLAGYGATQAVPGPLFTFAAFLGASMQGWPGGWIAGLLALGAVFLPSYLLVMGALPFWDQLRRNAKAQSMLTGLNAAVVGLLLAALWNPVITEGVHRPSDALLAGLALLALTRGRWPPWAVVASCALGGWAWS